VGLIVTGLQAAGRYGYEAYDADGQKGDPYRDLLSRPPGASSPQQAR